MKNVTVNTDDFYVREDFRVGLETLAALVEEDSSLDAFTADGTLAHAVATQLARAVTTHEDHVLQPVQTHWAHGLGKNTNKVY